MVSSYLSHTLFFSIVFIAISYIIYLITLFIALLFPTKGIYMLISYPCLTSILGCNLQEGRHSSRFAHYCNSDT